METSPALDALIAALERGDLDDIADYVHADFEGVVPPSMSAEPDSYRGQDGVRRYMELFREMVDDLVFRIRPLEEDGEWILHESQVSGTGRASGVPVELKGAGVIQMRDGKLLRMVGYPTLEEARAAFADR